MIVIPRGIVRSLRAIVRKCQVARPRPPAPPVLVDAGGNRLCLSCVLDGVTVSIDLPEAASEEGRFMLPMSALDDVEGAAVEVTVKRRKGTVRWEGPDGPKTLAFEALEPAPQYERPPLPGTFEVVDATILRALYECGRVAAREPSRFALHRVQVNGKSGIAAATDGKLALICRGLTLPFRESILVPAIPVFSLKELSSAGEVRVGRTETHLVIQADAWALHLAVDVEGRFPDVTALIPKSSDASIVEIDAGDAQELMAALPEWPESSDGVAAVTIEVETGISCRVCNDATAEVREMHLTRSTSSGPKIQLALERRHLARALELGCHSLRLAPGTPVVAENAHQTLIAVALGDDHVVTAMKAEREQSPAPIAPPSRRLLPAKTESSGMTLPERESDAGWIDPLAEVEALRTALAGAITHAGRLAQCLRQLGNRRNVLEQAWTSLRSLSTGSGGGS